VTITYIGTSEREYYGTRRLSSGELTMSIVDASTDYTNQRYSSTADGRRDALLMRSSRVYDPTARPWYRIARRVGGPAWTGIYPDFSSGVLGITAARPYEGKRGELSGVLATDLLFDQVATYLEELRAGREGAVFVMELSGLLVSTSSGEPMIVRDGTGDGRRAIAVDSAEPMTRAAARRLRQSYVDFGRIEQPLDVRFTLDGELHYLHAAPFDDGRGQHLVIAVAIPQRVFTQQIRANVRNTAILCAVALLLATLLGVWLTRRITRPLSQLSEEMRHIALLELESENDYSSSLSEIDTIQTAVLAMRRGLRSFQKYVSADLVRGLIKAGREAVLGVDPAEVSMFFSDIAGFSTISESISEDALVELMGEYLGEMTTVILESGGTLDKYMGDAIMAFWNAPIPLEQHAHAACRVALRCQRKLRDLREDWERRGLPLIYARVGLHTGRVRVGNFGSKSRMDYTIIGDAVNLCARLEGLNRYYGTEILVGEETQVRVRDAMLFRPIDLVAVKGRVTPERIFELMAPRADATAAQRALAAGYAEALERYLAQDFAGAAGRLDALLREHPEDRASQALRERCHELTERPPGPDWDGVYVHKQK
jgi:adenylate cyclase